MSHQEAVTILKQLPKDQGWSGRQALEILTELNAFAFTRRSDYAEAVTAAMIGHRWEAVSGRRGYDTASTLRRWLGKAAREYRDTVALFDAKTRQEGVGYSEKVTERANKAAQFNAFRDAGSNVINGVVFHTASGVFFHLGIDHKSTTPQFGTERRPIVKPHDLAGWIDGGGGILPAVLLTSNIIWDGTGFVDLSEKGIREVLRNLTRLLMALIDEVGMEKLQRHLDTQAQKAVKQATKRMLANKTSRKLVAEEVARNRKARQVVAREMDDEELLAEVKRRGLGG